ncbi:MAG TPA: hypothetical protein VMS41_06940 [Gaiellaceae bacterium]|nr:hypothetical protein [Gaiellaceae bacterium]
MRAPTLRLRSPNSGGFALDLFDSEHGIDAALDIKNVSPTVQFGTALITVDFNTSDHVEKYRYRRAP